MAEKDLQKLTQEFQRVKIDRERQLAVIAELESRKGRHDRLIQTATTEYKTLQRNTDNLETALASAKLRYEQAKKKSDLAKDKMENVTEQMTDINQRLDAEQHKHDETNRTFAEMEREIKDLEPNSWFFL